MELGACPPTDPSTDPRATMASRQLSSRNADRQHGSGDRIPDYTALQSALVGAVSSVFSRFGQSSDTDSAQSSHPKQRDVHPRPRRSLSIDRIVTFTVQGRRQHSTVGQVQKSH